MALLSEFAAGLNDSSLPCQHVNRRQPSFTRPSSSFWLPSSSPEVVIVVLNAHSWKLRLILVVLPSYCSCIALPLNPTFSPLLSAIGIRIRKGRPIDELGIYCVMLGPL
ncbi:hypothetical protein WG66_004140 [Moniliophthora roreri]|uniref:Uncharacterized protein n=1 Tax=Moniliophthora roreri TaxID=221103 RepID=A0A0W0G133_MONRR|nr:hypothetical protein WG66_004140 [Moniliophthora roreri]